jgi:hypothetical protein
MSELQRILEKYKKADATVSRAGKDSDEQRFVDKHIENVSVFDGPGVAEVEKAAQSVGMVDRNMEHGYNPGQDAEVYENFSIEDLQSVFESIDIDQTIAEEVISTLKESAPSHVLKVIDEAVQEYYDDATEEEKEMLDEMLSTSEGYEELLSHIFEEEEEDEDDDEDDEDDDDDSDDDEDGDIDVDPKMKKSDKSE